MLEAEKVKAAISFSNVRFVLEDIIMHLHNKQDAGVKGDKIQVSAS